MCCGHGTLCHRSGGPHRAKLLSRIQTCQSTLRTFVKHLANYHIASLALRAADTDVSASLVERAAKTTAAKKVEFSVFPKVKPTWKNTLKTKWKKTAREVPVTRTIPPSDDVASPTVNKRAQKTAQAGGLMQGNKEDSVLTYHVINCIAIAAYDAGTGKKVMAHINGIQGSKTYADQFNDFATIVAGFSVSPRVTIRLPVASDFQGKLSAAALEQQTTMQTSIKSWAELLVGGSVTAKTRTLYEGDMIMNADGSVLVDTDT